MDSYKSLLCSVFLVGCGLPHLAFTDPELSPNGVENAKNAVSYINEVGGCEIVAWTDKPQSADVTVHQYHEDRCVGLWSGGPVTYDHIWIAGDNCPKWYQRHTAIHEFMHFLGFGHDYDAESIMNGDVSSEAQHLLTIHIGRLRYMCGFQPGE